MLLHGTIILILLRGLRGLLAAALLGLGRLHFPLQHLHLAVLLRVVRRQVSVGVLLPAVAVDPSVRVHPLLQAVDRRQRPGGLAFIDVMILKKDGNESVTNECRNKWVLDFIGYPRKINVTLRKNIC